MLEGIEIVCMCPISPLNNCSDQVIDMAQIQQIYARLVTHIDAEASTCQARSSRDGITIGETLGVRLGLGRRRSGILIVKVIVAAPPRLADKA